MTDSTERIAFATELLGFLADTLREDSTRGEHAEALDRAADMLDAAQHILSYEVAVASTEETP